MPAAVASSTSRSSAPQANAKNSKLRAREEALEAALVHLRREAAEWRACATKYLSPATLAAAAARTVMAAGSDSDGEEDEELLAKYDTHAALGGALAGGINGVFSTVCLEEAT